MKLTGELKLVYRTTSEDLDKDPHELGQQLLQILVGDILNSNLRPRGKIGRASYGIVSRPVGAPEACPIDLVLEARVSYFEERVLEDVAA